MEVATGRPQDVTGRLEKEIAVYDFLDRLNIVYSRVDHAPAETMEACKAIDEALDADICKNLFLCNRQKTSFYLLLMPADKPFRTRDLSGQLGVSRLSFGDAGDMLTLLNLTPGSVTVFGLLFDPEQKVQLLMDADVLKQEKFGGHPCINTASVCLDTADLTGKILPALGRSYIEVNL